MKRAALCVFSLIAFVLIFCTLLAPCVERQMSTKVEIHHVYDRLVMHNHTVPAMSVKWPDGYQLYQVVEGKGWKTGPRVAEVSPSAYTLEEATINRQEKVLRRVLVLPGKSYDIILAASRQPVEGDAIVVVDAFREREDTYIVYYPDGATKIDGYPNSFTKIYQSQQALLVTPMKAYSPFFEQKIINNLQNMQTENLRAYSLADIKQFYAMMPTVCFLALILLMGLFLWVYSCVIAIKADRSPLLWRNAVFGVGLLCAIPSLTARIDLPVSLLPKQSILDFGHYRNEFRNIFGALESVGSDLLQQDQLRCARTCGRILIIGVVLMLLLVCLDWLWKKLYKKEPRS